MIYGSGLPVLVGGGGVDLVCVRPVSACRAGRGAGPAG